MNGEGFLEGCANRGGVCDCNGRPCAINIRESGLTVPLSPEAAKLLKWPSSSIFKKEN